MPVPRVITVLWWLGAAGFGAAQQTDGDRFLGRTVRELRFLPAGQPLPDEELRGLIPLRTGQTLTRDNIKQSIEALFRTGRFADVVVEATEAGPQADIVIRTAVNWFIGRVDFAGVADPPSAGQLYNATKLDLGQPLDEGVVNQAKESIETALRLNGLYESRVTHTIQHDAESQSVNIHFTVSPGRRARFMQPRFTGEAALPVARLVRATNWDRVWGLMGWKTMTQTRVQAGVDRMRQTYLKSNYLMARVSLDGMIYQPASASAMPVIALEPGPLVEVRATGAKLSRGRIRQLVPIYQEQSVDRSLLLEGQRNVQQYFQTQGYFDAAVDFTVRDEAKRKFIEYTVDRGARHKLVRLTVTGYRYFDLKTLRERMQSTPATLLRYRQGRFGSRLIEQDEASIRDLYRSNGFLDAKVTHQIEPGTAARPNEEAVTVTIDEGPQTLVARVDLEGVSPERIEYLRSLLQTQEGQPYSEQSIGADRDVILNEYFNNGFSGASVESLVAAGRPSRQRMAVKLYGVGGRPAALRAAGDGGWLAHHRIRC